MSYVAGPYTATYRGSNIGVTERGWEMEFSWLGEPVIGDNLAQAVQDHVYQGGNIFWSAVMNEYNAAAAALVFWPYGTFGQSGQVGCMDTDVQDNLAGSGGLVLTAVAGCSRAASVGPATITMDYAMIAKNFPIRMLFAAAHRKIGIRMQVYPDGAQAPTQSGNQTWFSVT